MSSPSKRIVHLSSEEKQALLEQLLRKKLSKPRCFPLSFAQQRIWFLDQLQPGSPLYTLSEALFLDGSLNRVALEWSLNQIVRRHEALRTTFAIVADQPVQLISPELTLKLPVVDLSTLPTAEEEAQVQQLVAQEAQAPFDLAVGPLIRARLLQLQERRYVLLIAIHHIVSDGWSMEVFFRELVAHYKAFGGSPPPLPELTIQYADFTLWQHEWLQGEALETQLTYWKRQLEDAPTALQLPTDRPRPVVQTFRGTAQSFVLPAPLSKALKTLSEQEGVTLFMTLLATFNVLLFRYTGQNDLLVGAPVANRTHVETENLIGFFANTLVLRTRLSGVLTFRELLGQVREVALGAYDHQDLPFERLVEELHPQRDLSRNPLFQVAFSMQNTPTPHLILPGLTSHRLEIADRGIAKFDVMLSLESREQELAGVLQYNTDLFDSATIARMIGHYHTLLEGIVVDPGQCLSELPLLTKAELHHLLVKWNNTTSKYRSDMCLHQLFEAQVGRTPEEVAVVFEDEQMTYHELNQQANQLAHYLRAVGVGPEVRVGIYVERSLQMIVGLLGILKAGGAYVPLDPTYPQERLAFMLEDAQVRVLLTQERLVEQLPEHKTQVVCLDADWDHIAQQSGGSLISGVSSENLAYVIYTSGSTGRPKGVAVEHRQILNYVQGILERLNLPVGTTFATVSTIAADLGNTVIFPSLCAGGCLHIISRERTYDPGAFSDYARSHQIDCLKIVPSHLLALLASSHPEHILPRQLLVLGGEAARWDWIQRLQVLAPDCLVLNHYGPTETTVGVLTYSVEKGEIGHRSNILPLGHPLASTQIYLLDRHLQPVPIGIPGEVYIGGLNVARGYLDRPELTAERFVPHPFSAEPGARLYRTGDLARYLPNGAIEFLGRLDQQIKLRGFRIELGEIETILGQHLDVQEAIVMPQEDTFGNKRLIAYVVPIQERASTIAGQRRYTLPNNLAVAHLHKNETDYLYREIFELQSYLRHGIVGHDGDCIFDVGANIGLFTLFIHQVCKNPKVYAFEPNPIIFEKLRTNTSLYAPSAKLFSFGLSSGAKAANLTFFPGFSLLSGFYADAETEREVVKSFMLNQQKMGQTDMALLIEQADEILKERFASKTIAAQLRTLSAVIEEEHIQRIDLLKINVEKSELDVVTGIKDDDWKKIQQVVLEVDVKENLAPIVEMLGHQGYDVFVEQDALLENTQLCYVYAIRKASRRTVVREQAKGEHIRPLPVLNDPFLSPGELSRYLKERLPEYMIPSTFVLVDVLPLTPNGKVDRQALPDPESLRTQSEVAYVPPQSEVERTIAHIWQKVLHRERVSTYDSFFDLGGHSLLIAQVYSQLRKIFPDLSMVDLFQYPTIGSLAKYLSQDRSESTSSQQVDNRFERGREGRNRLSLRLEQKRRAARTPGGPSDE